MTSKPRQQGHDGRNRQVLDVSAKLHRVVKMSGQKSCES